MTRPWPATKSTRSTEARVSRVPNERPEQSLKHSAVQTLIDGQDHRPVVIQENLPANFLDCLAIYAYSKLHKNCRRERASISARAISQSVRSHACGARECRSHDSLGLSSPGISGASQIARVGLGLRLDDGEMRWLARPGSPHSKTGKIEPQ